MPRFCKYQPPVTAEDLEDAAQIAANGGTLTAEELAHSRTWQRVGMAWTRARANRMIQAHGWTDAHAHGDGSVYRLRVADYGPLEDEGSQ